MLIALLALPVLLVLGLLAGNALTDNDTVEVAGGTPVGATPSISAPALQGPTVATTPAPTTEAPEATPAPTTPSATTPAPTTPAATTVPPTTAPASTPAEATSAPATSTPTASPTTTAPRASPTPTPTATSPPADQDEQAGDEPGSSDSGDGTAARSAPAPDAGRDVVYAQGSTGEDVRTWQARMVERGWALRADGIFGPRTESVVRSFQAEKGLTVDGLLGRRTWDAAWTTPIT